ncbi:hypothetical protein BDQ12DRAFT_614491, partial [Crucibulum laeve]
LIDKYSIFAADNEIYIIAVVMCPDHKLKWFKDHGHTITQIKGIEKMVANQWKNFYVSPDMEDTDTSRRQQPLEVPHYAAGTSEPKYGADNILTYLKEPLLSHGTIQEAGGYMKYWQQVFETRPALSGTSTQSTKKVPRSICKLST